MSATTSIAWTEKTWNPVRGCSVISPGCTNCYAMKQAHRFSGEGLAYFGLTKQTTAGPQWTGQVRCVDEALDVPLRWKKPARIFVNSMSDLFHEDVPDAFIDRVFAVMALCPQHTFQILTKRAERMRAYFGHHEDEPKDLRDRIDDAAGNFGACHANLDGRWPLPNVWLVVSAENQKFADERIPLLLQTPAAVRGVSLEPLLGPVDLTRVMLPNGGRVHALGGTCTFETDPPDGNCFKGLDWVIVGGESGPGARPMDLAWARAIVQQCKAAGVACFVKQLGAVPMLVQDDRISENGFPLSTADRYASVNGRILLRDKKGGDPAEWPEDLRVREFPTPRIAAVAS